MACSPLAIAKRAFVSVLLALAAAYNIAVNVTRDSADEDLLKAYRRVALKAHPDKGGQKKQFQQLQEVREKWEEARKESGPRGRRWPESESLAVARTQASEKVKDKHKD